MGQGWMEYKVEDMSVKVERKESATNSILFQE
jgi:hypothetical protein